MALLGVASVAVVLGACSGGGSESSSTLAPIESTVFQTIPTTSTTLSPESSLDASGGALGGEIIYEVLPGDYWTGIAQKFGCPNYLEVIAYNDNKEAIFPGDEIKIPASCGQTPETTSAESGSTDTTVATATTLGEDGSATYTIVAGDTLSGIATKFNTTMNAIVAINGWSDGIEHNLFPGDDIKVPVAAG
jgi:LysM repeat protein